MKKPDARLLNPTTQNYLRQQAIRLREQGKRIIDIAAYLGVHRNTITGWWKDYQTDGEAGLEQQQRGAKYGEGRRLSADQETQIQDRMRDHFPDELGIDSALWTRRAVQTLMEQEYGVAMPIPTVGEYLKRWGYTPQKPLKRAYEQDPKAVEQWLDETYPALVKQAVAEGAEVAWGDESGLRSDAQAGRGYAPKGKTPATNLSQKKRHRINFIASVSNQGLVRFMLYAGKLDSLVFITFLERLTKQQQRKLYWIVDRHPVHQAQAVQDWLARHTHQERVGVSAALLTAPQSGRISRAGM